MRRCLPFFVLVLTLVSCSPVQSSQVPTGTAVVLTSTLEPTSTPVPQTPTLTPEELLKAHPEIVAVEQYGMPQEMADKLVGLSVSFEVITKNVDGVLVNESGADVFYFDRQTEFLVAVDRWPRITEIERIWENEMTEEELFSDEYFAWLKYIASTLEFNIEKIEANLEKKVTELVNKGWLTEEKAAEAIRTKSFPMEILSDGSLVPMVMSAPNFSDPETAPFKRMEALAFVRLAELTEKYADGYGSWEGPLDTFVVLPNFRLAYDVEKDVYQIYPEIENEWNSEKQFSEVLLPAWESGMNITVIDTDKAEQIGNPLFEDTLSSRIYHKFGKAKVDKAYNSLLIGDPSLVSQPGFVSDTKLVSEKHYK